MLALVAAPGKPGNVELREVAEPRPRPHEAMVEVRAVSLNRGELNRLGRAADGWRPGWDVAGVVTRRAADGSGPPDRARVVGLTSADGGGWAQRVPMSTRGLASIPDAVTFSRAAALPIAGLTALRALRLGGLLVGHSVLVSGAAGGVGRLAIQLARLGGAAVTAVAGSPERAEGLAELGANGIVLSAEDVESASQHLVLESAGGQLLAEALRVIAPRGTVVTFGNSSREATTVPINDFYAKEARLKGFFIFRDVERSPVIADLTGLLALVSEGRLEPGVGLEADWHDAAAALHALQERRVRGKTVLRVTG